MTIGTTWESINSAFCLPVSSLSSGTNFLIYTWVNFTWATNDRLKDTDLQWNCLGLLGQKSSQEAQHPNLYYRELLSPFWGRTEFFPTESSTLNFLTWLLKYSLIQSLYKYLPFPPVSWSTCVSYEFSVLQSARTPFCLKLHGTKAGKIDQLEKCLLKKPKDLGSKLRTHVKRREAQ